MVLSFSALAPTQANALIMDPDEPNTQCSDALVLFARGSGQNGTATYPDLNPLFADSGIRSGQNETNAFFKGIYDKFGTSLNVEYSSLGNFPGHYNPRGYKALGSENFNKKPLYRKDVPNRYYESVKDGVEELTWFLEDRMTSCPLQQVVLGGYSQGAQVVGETLWKLQPAFRARIAYAAMYGDPKFNPAQSLLPPKFGWWNRGNTDISTHGILDQRKNYVPAGIANVGSWCQVGDVICDAGTLNVNVVNNYLIGKISTGGNHSNTYQEKWIPKSAAEIAKALRTRLPNAEAAGTNVFINKNDKLYQMDLAVVIDTSSSMQSKLQTIKGNVAGLAGGLLGSYWDTRVGVVTYSGFPYRDDPNHTYSSIAQPFTNDRAAVTASIRSLSTQSPYFDTSGNQLFEYSPQYSGLMTAMNSLQWREGAQKKIIVITDKAASSPDPSTDHWNSAQVQRRALELDPAVLNFANVSCDENFTCDNEAVNAMQTLAHATNGAASNINLSFDDTTDLAWFIQNTELTPAAQIDGTPNGYVGTPLNLSADESYDPDAPLTDYQWDCNDDGIWDITAETPNAACEYTKPYDGLVVLQVRSQDGGSAKAIFPVHIAAGTSPVTAAPDKPNAAINYRSDGALLSWNNTYEPDVFIKIADGEGNLVGYSPADANGVLLAALGSEMTELHVSAGNSSAWSEPTILLLDRSKLEAVTNDENIETFTIIPFSENQAEPPANPATTNPAEQTNQHTPSSSTSPNLANAIIAPAVAVQIAAIMPIGPQTSILGAEDVNPAPANKPKAVPNKAIAAVATQRQSSINKLRGIL